LRTGIEQRGCADGGLALVLVNRQNTAMLA
jgi:hypothetical protein